MQLYFTLHLLITLEHAQTGKLTSLSTDDVTHGADAYEVEFIGHVPTSTWRESGKLLWQNYPQSPDLDLNSDLPVIGDLVICENDVLDHVANEAGLLPASVAELANALIVLSPTAEDGEIEVRISVGNGVESRNATIFLRAGLWPRAVQLAILRMRSWWSFGAEHLEGKKKIPSEPGCCPVCGVTVRSGELESHFVQELERLYKLSVVNRGRRQPLGHPTTSNSNRRTDTLASTADGTLEGRWDTYQRIKANRQSRLRIKNRKRKVDEATCPVCNERVQGSVEDLNCHVEMCLRKVRGNQICPFPAHQARVANHSGAHGGAPEEDENVDVEGDAEMYEDFEWAGQRRIRATSLLMGGFMGAGMAACGTSSSRRPSPVDEDVDLVVDGDDSATYGPSQYSEQDVIVMSADGGPHEDKEREALREAVISPDGSKRSPGSCSTPTSSCGVRGGGGSGDAEVKEEPSPTAKSGGGLEDNLLTALEPDTINTVLEALKTRIRELEGETRVAGNDKFKCLICMIVHDWDDKERGLTRHRGIQENACLWAGLDQIKK
uniref:E3 ubiquitin-protein ligase RNF220 middle domain-containing protein n=1 Tax=Timema genevievae TaxID=629358 RepID=A0A7R9JME7_TIMGE|nr:unnamed protein product [Timema genevievae]